MKHEENKVTAFRKKAGCGMKKYVVNMVAGIVLCVSLFVLLMQGFALPSIGAASNFLLRIVAAASAQILFCANIKQTWLRIIPIVLTAACALWGGWLFLTSDSWVNATFWGYFADYCTPTLGCAVTYCACSATRLQHIFKT